MKNKLILPGIFLAVILAISSCKEEDDDSDDIIGTWTSQTLDFEAMVGDKTVTQYFIDVMGFSPTDAQLYTAIFNATVEQTLTGSITLKADQTYTSTFGGQNETGTWSRSADGNKLTIDSDNDHPVVLDIVKLTSNELQLHWIETRSIDVNGDDVPETINGEVDMTFVR